MILKHALKCVTYQIFTHWDHRRIELDCQVNLEIKCFLLFWLLYLNVL